MGGGGVKQQSYVRQDVKKKHCYSKRSSYHAISLLVLRNSYFIDTTHYITLLLFNVTLSLVVIVTLYDCLLCSAKTLAFILFSLVFVLSRRLFSQHRQSVINKRSSELHVANLQLQKWAPAPTKTVDNLVRKNQLFKKTGPFQWNKIICHTTKSQLTKLVVEGLQAKKWRHFKYNITSKVHRRVPSPTTFFLLFFNRAIVHTTSPLHFLLPPIPKWIFQQSKRQS